MLAKRSSIVLFGLLLASGAGLYAGEAPRQREFLFTYSVTAQAEPGTWARIWLPLPPSNEDQEVAIVNRHLPPKALLTTEPKYGNQMVYVKHRANEAGEIRLAVTYRVKRYEIVAPRAAAVDEQPLLERFMQPDAKVPVGGKCLVLLEGRQLPMEAVAAARMLYDLVYDHMRYAKDGTGWGQGDAEWACQSGYGNCTDFHSLFIALARHARIPARFEIGFPLPRERGSGTIAGYHCWAKFYAPDQGWIPVDISEADKNPALREYYFGHLTEDRVVFSMGRDIDLEPRQAGPPLNFFVYPYVEVGERPLPADKLRYEFSYEDLLGE
jgi:transglutaminase-like putative cysteine protease